MSHPNYLRFNILMMMIALIFVLTASIFGQQAATATIEGIVTDPNKAAVPGAKVTIKNLDIGLTREITTDGSGIYRFAALTPGTYQISASGQSFAENKYGVITLTVGQKLNLDLTLRVTVSETVIITDIAPIIETTRSQVSSSVGERAVRELPVNGRNFIDFVTLTPGVCEIHEAEIFHSADRKVRSTASKLTAWITITCSSASLSAAQDQAAPLISSARTRCRSFRSTPTASQLSSGVLLAAQST